MKYQREMLLAGVVIEACMEKTASLSASVSAIPSGSVGLDSVVLSLYNLKLLKAIAAIYGIRSTDESDNKFISSLLGLSYGTFIVKSLLSWIPGAGSAINAKTSSDFTSLVGWAVVNSLEQSGGLEPITSKDMDMIKKLQSKMSRLLKSYLVQFTKAKLREIQDTAAALLSSEQQDDRESTLQKLQGLLFTDNTSGGNSTVD
jgi:uncharacterized protein (DUF697 family)